MSSDATDRDGEIARLRAENDVLRSLLPKLKAPCVYCGLEEIGRCTSGFPGCAQADDILCGDDETLRRLRDEVKRLKELIGKDDHGVLRNRSVQPGAHDGGSR